VLSSQNISPCASYFRASFRMVIYVALLCSLRYDSTFTAISPFIYSTLVVYCHAIGIIHACLCVWIQSSSFCCYVLEWKGYFWVPYYIHLISKCLCIVICVLDAMNGCSIDIVQSSLEHHTHMCYIAVSKYCYQWPITPTRTSLTSFFCSLTMQCTRGTRAAKARFINYLQHPPAVYTRFHPA